MTQPENESTRATNLRALDEALRAEKRHTKRAVAFVVLILAGLAAWSFLYRMPAGKEIVLTAVVTGHTSRHSLVGNLPYLMVALPSGDRVRVRRHLQPNHQIGDFVTVIESKRLFGTPRYRLADSLR